MFSFGLDWVTSLTGVEMIVLFVRAGTKAESVYRHLGFKEFGRLNNGIKELSGDIYDEVYMVKMLD